MVKADYKTSQMSYVYVAGHPWQDVDLVLIHTNATPRQLVAVSDATKVEVWDRVRLLLSLFNAHANSLEARTQVRLHAFNPIEPS